jgi:hypothetical protein
MRASGVPRELHLVTTKLAAECKSYQQTNDAAPPQFRRTATSPFALQHVFARATPWRRETA